MSDRKFELIPLLETSLDRQLRWIGAADTRISLILPLATAMLGTLAALSPSYASWHVGLAICSSAAAGLLVLSIIFVALACFPRTEGPKGSTVFFGGISNLSIEQFQHSMKGMTTEQYETDLILQCHRNAEIAAAKFRWVQKALAFLLLAALPWAISIFLLYVASNDPA